MWNSPEGSIRTQLIKYMSLLVMLPFCVGLLVLNIYLQKVVRESKESHDNASMMQIRSSVDQQIEMTNYSTSTLMIDENVMSAVKLLDTSEDSYELYQARRLISDQITSLENSVLSAVGGKIMLLTEAGYYVGASHLGRSTTDYCLEEWYRKILENGNRIIFVAEAAKFFNEVRGSLLTGENLIKDYECLYIGRSVQDYTRRNLGILLVRLPITGLWDNFVAPLNLSESGMMYILDGDGRLLVEYDEKQNGISGDITEEAFGWDLNRDRVTQGVTENGYHYMAVLLEYSGNILVYAIPNEEYQRDSRGIATGILGMLVFLIILTAVTMVYASGRLSSPLISVTDSLDHSENGLSVIEQPRYSFSEITRFVTSYNQACRRIEELLNRVRMESGLREKARYEMLMSQISPHFMFNTVNSIRIMAKEEHDRKTERALEALGEILHAVYKDQDGMTSVGQETVVVQAYVDIMKIRYGDFFQYYNAIPTELYIYEIPAFTLQPLVENAILHGVRNILAGQIIVSAEEYEKDLMISVFDNGRTADKEMMKQLLSKPGMNKSSFTGIALYNINERLRMLYGSSYGLIFNEDRQDGFEIMIRIPRKISEHGDKK